MYAPPYSLSLLIHLFLDKLMPIIWLALHIRLPIAILTQPLVAVLRTFSTHVIWPFNSTISRWAESSPQILSSDNIPQHTCTNHNRECGYLDRFIIVLLPDIPSWLGSTSRYVSMPLHHKGKSHLSPSPRRHIYLWGTRRTFFFSLSIETYL